MLIPILWPPDVKNWLTERNPDSGKDWRQEEKEDEMRWHYLLDGHAFEHVPGVGDGQGSLACWSPWGHKEPDMTERLNWLTDFPTGNHRTVFYFCDSICFVKKFICTIFRHMILIISSDSNLPSIHLFERGSIHTFWRFVVRLFVILMLFKSSLHILNVSPVINVICTCFAPLFELSLYSLDCASQSKRF